MVLFVQKNAELSVLRNVLKFENKALIFNALFSNFIVKEYLI